MPEEAVAVQVLVLQGGAWGTRRMAPFFSYSLPEELAESVVPGHLVMVPFGDMLVTGLVWERTITPELPFDQLRPIHSLLDPLPLLDAPRRALALWLAEAYVCSLVNAVQVMLPGMTGGRRINLVQTGAAETELSEADPETRALRGLMHQARSTRESVVRSALGTRRAGRIIAALEDEGTLTREIHLPLPRMLTPDTLLRLTAPPDVVAAWRAEQVHLLAPPPFSIPPRLPASGAATRGVPLKRSRGALLQALGSAGVVAQPRAKLGTPLSARDAVQIRGAIALVDLLSATPLGQRSQREALRLTRATPAALARTVDAGLIVVEAPPEISLEDLATERHALTPAQAAALAHIVSAMDAATDLSQLEASHAPDNQLLQAARPILLHGVTGSGKTEVYLQAMEATIARGRQGIVLVPEIALTPQTIGRFSSRFPSRVALLHGALKPRERAREWERIRAGGVDVVVGPRSAIFAPLPDLGLIILDEEHESTYKQEDRSPTFHAREVAFALGKLTGAAVVLGSATPATESYYRALNDELALVVLPERVSSASAEPPPVTIVDLRAELRDGHPSILSRPLLAAMDATLGRGEQVVLYLNRRGAASCVICRDCGFVARCGRCDVSLTHHLGQNILLCHYCGWHEPPPVTCFSCGGPGIRYFNIGTERIEVTVRERFPQARVLRWDNDTIHAHTDHAIYAAALANHEVDILIGTQMIAKGLDIPGVTLVGIIAADVSLYTPDYRATERAFQLLTQVAGRAGRGERPGQVFLQTFSPDHFCIEAAARHDYQAFYSTEIAARTGYGYPPFRRFVKLTYIHRDRHVCQTEAFALGDHLTRIIADLGLPDTDLVGPAPAYTERLDNLYYWQIILRGPDPRAIIAALTSREIGPGWAIDIDPLSSL